MYWRSVLSRRFVLLVATGLLLLITVLLWQLSKTSTATEGMWVFHVPGEAIFLVLPGGHQVLVDAGENNDTAIKLAGVLPFWSREIDVLFLTHADRDHIGGALAILQQFSIKAVVLPGSFEDSLLFEAIKAEVRRQNIPLLYAAGTTDFQLADTTIDILYPQESVLAKITSERNTTSLIMRLVHNNASLLFTGDADRRTETAVLSTPVRLQSLFLKVPHHGSKSSSSPSFLTATEASVAAVSAHSDNQYGHPHQEVVDRFQKKQIPLFNTGKIGDIHLRIFDFPFHHHLL